MLRTIPPQLPALLLLLPSLVAQHDHEAAWQQFVKAPAAAQQEALVQLLQNLPEQAIVRAQQKLADEAGKPGAGRGELRGSKAPKQPREFPEEVVLLPRRVDYVFGTGTIAPRAEGLLPEHAPKHGVGARTPGDKKAPKVPFDPTPMHQALLGCVPDADLALAALLRRLDADPRGDTFAVFLQVWRNGKESFYEALDRTAGTPDSVFFFDVMLGDFRGQFARGADGKKLPGGLQQAHDALHAAFLAYRQYRGFREAIAWSLVLPVDAPLPPRLARYEAAAPGGYSLRQQVLMVDLMLGHDIDALVKAVLDEAPQLPQPIWDGGHDPYAAWTPFFTGLLPKMIERAGSSDALLEQAQHERRVLATALLKVALEHCEGLAAAH
ncbi:MAG: hypothetical protein K8J09_13625 [Planctomycetes bacterium]|nr:hypothetical protein [Planctomycetota bacterium]MCC7397665.1 hypothetical protein [Planctomycetota bacterium]